MPTAPAVADELQATGAVCYVAAYKPGYPCRQCLGDAEIGDAVILVAHDPFKQNSPYRSAGPIFLHDQPVCRSDGHR